MKVRLVCSAVLILTLAVMLGYSQDLLPAWSSIVPGIEARNHFTVNGSEDMMTIVGAASNARIDNAARLTQALREIRTQSPEAFDAIFAKYELALQ